MPQEIREAIRSEEVEDIINAVPHRIVRWGITVIFIIAMLLLMVTWFIRYPDIIKASLRLTSYNAPKSVVARLDGQIAKILVKENSLVNKNDVLAYMESTANPEQILSLSKIIDSIGILIYQNKIELFRPISREFDQLGEIQASYQTFQISHVQFLEFINDGFFIHKKQLLQRDLDDLKLMEQNLLQQERIYKKDYELAIQEHHVQEKLYKEKVISTIDFKREESKLLSKELPVKHIENSLINNQSAQNSKLKEILELNKTISEQKSLFLQSLNTLKSALQSWVQKHVLLAPVSGKINYVSFLQENQYVNNQEELFIIIPDDHSYFGELIVSQTNFGKVEVGQEVIVKFDSYPFEEFGKVKGVIQYISDVPTKDNSFLARVSFPEGLATNYKQKIPYKADMTAQAEIVTKDLRLLERFFYNLIKLQNH